MAESLSRGRRTAIAIILIVALVLGFAAVFSTWIKRQALDTHHWTNTSTKLLANDKIQAALGIYLADQVFSNVDVEAQLRSTLPGPTQALAAPAAAGLRELGDRAAPELLARPRIQALWKASNEAAHKQLIKVLKGGGPNVSTDQGKVTLNLHNIADQLAANLGVESQLAAARQKLPVKAGNLVILRSDEIKTAQDVAEGVKNLSILLTILSLGLFALAVALAPGHRRGVICRVGWSFVALRLGSLLIRRLSGNAVVDGLVQAETVKPPAHEAWDISTPLLYTMAISGLIYGFVIIGAAWVAGATGSATAVRRSLAPSMRERPGLVYGSAGLVYLLVLAWGPTPAFRNVLPVLLIGATLVAGIEALRRQTAREFPDAKHGDTTQAVRGLFDRGNGLDDLERLTSLHDRGLLTDEEFKVEKALVLHQP